MAITAVNGSVRPSEAEATATAIPAGPESESQRVGVHPGGDAPAPSRGRARPRAKDSGGKFVAFVNAALRRDNSHGAPWQEAPASLTALRTSIHDRAKDHAVFPCGKQFYIGWGYAFVLPLSAVAYTLLWLGQAPGRTWFTVAVLAIVHFTHPLGSLPVVGHLPVIRFF